MEIYHRIIIDRIVQLNANSDIDGGKFNKLRSGGFKGPVLQLRRLLCRRLPLISVNEFRTSKLCFQCGKTLQHPCGGKMHSVSYCTETDHHCMINRDTDAARKIGCRFFTQLLRKDLGPWAFGTSAVDSPVVINGNALKTLHTTLEVALRVPIQII